MRRRILDGRAARFARRSAVLALAPVTLAAWCAGQSSQHALRFHGGGGGTGGSQQDRVRVPIDDNAPGPDASAPCDLGVASFSVEFWLRGDLAQNATANAGGDVELDGGAWRLGNLLVDRGIGMVDCDAWDSREGEWGISVAGGFVRFGTACGNGCLDPGHVLEGNVDVLDGAWHHVACVRDAASGTKRIYVDAELDFESSPGVSHADLSYPNKGVPGQLSPWGPYLVLAAEKLGAGASNPSFDGFLDEVRLWTVARTQGELASTYDRVIPSDTPGLVASYRFEEGSGTSVADSSAAQSPSGVLVAGVPGNGEWVSASVSPLNTAPIATSPLPGGFSRATFVSGLSAPVAIEFAPDGRLFIAQHGGAVRVVENGTLLPAPVVQIPVSVSAGEHGVMGLALDPAFASNGYLYAFYTSPEPRNRVGRFTVVGNTASVSSEVVVWASPDLAKEFHHGGGIAFGRDGKLYVPAGDQRHSPNAQDLSKPLGKLLRLNPDGSIPPDNPFLGVPGAHPAIWALGLRNPFRIAFDALTGDLWIGDVGANHTNSWEDLERGARGANHGWPNQEGPLCYIPDCSPYAVPAWTYRHDDPTYFWGQAQASITAGAVYRGTQFPAEYRGNLFVGDYANRWIRRLVLDASGAVVADPVFLAAPHAGTILDLEVGPDGALYYVTLGLPWTGPADAAAVHKITYAAAGNLPPVAVASATPTQGLPPLTVQFSSAGSFDPDGGPSGLAYSWQFGDGGSSSVAHPRHAYAAAGPFEAVLMVSDGAAPASAPPISITVGNPPVATIRLPLQGAPYRAGDGIVFFGSGFDPDTGSLPASALSWEVLLVHAGHVHPFLGPLPGVFGGSFTIPASGHGPQNTTYRVRLTVTDPTGLQHAAMRTLSPIASTLNFDTVPSGIPIFLDGEALATPQTYVSLEGFQHALEAQPSFQIGATLWIFDHWSDGGARVHTYIAPPGGASVVATYAPAGPDGGASPRTSPAERDSK